MRTLLIHNLPFDGSSAGVRTMHYLATLLRAVGVDVAVTSPCYYNPAIPVRTAALLEDIAVYPDCTQDNPLGARHVCRYMLYYASAYFGGKRIARDECALVFQHDYLADIQAHCDHPVTEEDIMRLPTMDATWCFPEVKTIENLVYPGKGDINKMPPIPGPFTLIPKNPSGLKRGDNILEHQKTLALLRQAKKFYTLDEHTLMSCEAALCGCQVRILKNGRFEEDPDLMAKARDQILNPERGMEVARRFAGRVEKFFGGTIRPAAIHQPVNKIKVGVFTLDDEKSACNRLRISAPLEYLHARGKIEFLPLMEGPLNAIRFKPENIQQAQIIIVQRGMPAVLPFEKLREIVKDPSVKIVFELDDALTRLPAENPHANYYNSLRPRLEAYLRHSDLVTVSTDTLKETCLSYNNRIAVLPNPLDTKTWLPLPEKPRQTEKTSILFSGTLTHQNDLALIERAIERIIGDFGDAVEFLFWGNLPATLSKRPQARTLAEFTQDYGQYAARLKTLPVDLALVPLEVNDFNKAKSDIKWLEYSACKIPAIFTDIAAYNKSVEHGKTGWLVPNTAEAWYNAMKTLITDKNLRQAMAENAHRAVLAKRSVEAIAGLWQQAYENILNAAAKPAVSIIIPTFNNLPLTRQCLEAIQQNTKAGQYEVVIIDNASTDGTVDFLKAEEKAGRLRAILNPENTGFAHACNQGAAAARGDLLLFLNNDTRVTSGWLDALIATMQRPQAGVAGAKLLYGNGRIQHAGIEFIGNVPDHPHRHAAADAPEVNQFRELDMVTGACLAIRRDLCLQLAGFDEIYRNGVEDVDLCLRARAAGWKVVYEPKSVVFHLEGQSVGRFNHVNENLKIFFERWGKSFDAQKHFIVPSPVRAIASHRSFLKGQGAKPVKVAWEGTFLDFGSLSHVNRQMSRSLGLQPGVELSLVTTRHVTAPPCAEFKGLAAVLKPAADPSTQVTIRHQWPPDWSRPKNGALVIIQPWEFGALPAEWVQAAAQVDEFWLPSNYVRQVYIDSGVPADKLVVVPNGIEAEQFREEARPLPLATKKKFRFLFVGGTIHRKGPDVLLNAYLKTFTAGDDVCLVIKDFGGKSWYAGQTLESQIKALQSRPDAPEILYLTYEMEPSAMAGLYTACQCLVHPYRGEGFGLPVLEAMACGLPVILTGGGAADDFAKEEYVYRIPAQRKGIGAEISGQKLVAPGWMLEPDLAALGERMKWVMEHAKEARVKGHAASEYARREWTWQRGAHLAQERLQVLAARQPVAPATPVQHKPAVPAPIVLPEAAKLGQLLEAQELLKKKDFKAARDSICAAIAVRPFHPEAYLLLARVALEAGDAESARRSAQYASRLAPDWKPAKKFLKTIPSRGRKPGCIALPPAAGEKTASAPRLSVCLIVKNEEQFLERCLQSICDMATQIVVVDTGSTDGTVEIAKKFKAEVYSFTWNDDFSAARNEALKHVTGDWVLSLDADEELMPEHKQTLLDEMQAAKIIGYRVRIFNVGQEAAGCGYVPRLFRNAPGLFFVGRVHEEIFSSMESRANEWGLEHRPGRTAILHHGYKEEVVADRNKVARNLRLLRTAIEEMPGVPNLVMNLGLELIRSGQLDEGLEKYREAIELTGRLPAGKVTPEFCETLLTQYTAYLLEAGRFKDIAQCWQEPFAKAHLETASQHFMLGLAQIELHEPAAAVEQMRHCLAKRDKPAFSPINKHILGVVPRRCLAVSLMALGLNAEAEKAFREALAEDATSRPLRIDFVKFLLKEGKHQEALQIANDLVAEDATDVQTWKLGGHIALSRPEFLEFAQIWTAQAIKNAPEDSVILQHRAEALLLSRDAEAARLIWAKIQSPDSARHAAALVLCELVAGGSPLSYPALQEKAISQEFLKWYRRLIKWRANSVVSQINGRLELLRSVLPSAANQLSAAIKHAETAMAV